MADAGNGAAATSANGSARAKSEDLMVDDEVVLVVEGDRRDKMLETS